MNASRSVITKCGIAILSAMTGCASVMSGRHADVTFYSNVPDAYIAIRDKNGKQVVETQAGSTIALKRKDKWIFPARYTATVAAPGYEPAEVPISSTVNPWVLGNVAFLQLGLVGLAVDNATGAAWMPKEATYYQELKPMYGQLSNGPALYGAAGQPQQTIVGQSPGSPAQLGGPTTQVAVTPTEAPPTKVAPSAALPGPVLQTAAAKGATPQPATYR